MCLVLYGSVTGNTADLADTLYDALRRRGLARIECKPFGQASLADLQAHRHVFVLCATTGQGALPAGCQPLWGELLRRSLRAPALANVRLYSFGLGSAAYPRFNWAIRKIHSRLLQLGAVEAVARGEGDELGGAQPYEAMFDEWARMALSYVDSDLQIIETQPLTALLPPVYPLRLTGPYTPPPSPPPATRASTLLKATVVSNARLTGAEHFQDVRHLRLSLAGGAPDSTSTGAGAVSSAGAAVNKKLDYEPGDVLCLYPANDDVVVDSVIAAQGWEKVADAHVLVPRGYEPDGGWLAPLTLRKLLKWHVDLNAIPRRKFFVLAQHFCANPQHAERMREFAADLDDLFNYTSRPRRSVAEVVAEFDSLQIPTEYILDLLPPLRSRQFSIASGARDAGGAGAGTTTVELCVSVVKYRTMLRRIRRGLCTHWVEGLRPQDRIEVALAANTMRLADRVAARPQAIFVATGTGVAPMRSLLRTYAGPREKLVVFFGCRYAEQDFLYKDELEAAAGRVIPAFSREGGGYVQQQIARHGASLDVRNAFIFVCGSAGAMPRAVREAFASCLVAQGLSEADAEATLRAKEKTGDYMQETW